VEHFKDFRNKLECLSLASYSSLVKCVWLRPGAYPRADHLKDWSTLFNYYSRSWARVFVAFGHSHPRLIFAGKAYRTPH
jgi:hypothetical protein